MSKKKDSERAKAIFSEVSEKIDANIEHKLSGMSYTDAMAELTEKEKKSWFKTFVKANGVETFKKKIW